MSSQFPFPSWLRSPHVFVRQRVLRAAQAFIAVEASSGIVLLAAALAALVWANSPWSDSYFDLWHSQVVVDADLFRIEEDLRHWLNNGLMTIFFFLVGLEIKRELVHGELASMRRAALPVAAALGGMVAPALIYAALNQSEAGARGWGIPMATDIAFALGVLSLLSGRIPFSIKVFLLALAIADDIGAIIVIAVFYSSGLDSEACAVALLLLATIIALNRAGVRDVDLYVLLGVGLWVAALQSGVHATVAGVTLGLLTPASPFYGPRNFTTAAKDIVDNFDHAVQAGSTDEQQAALAHLEDLSQGTEAPLDHLERKLHPWVSYLIVPLFALANAGVEVSGGVLDRALESPVTLGVAIGLVAGKPLGIFLFTWLAVQLRLCELPAGASWSHIFGVGLLGGIGFTVSLLIAGLAFDDALLADEAKLGVLLASAVAGVVGFGFLWLTTRRAQS